MNDLARYIFNIGRLQIKTGSPRNTRIPEEIYKHATLWETETSFLNIIFMCSIVKVQVQVQVQENNN